MDIKKKRKLLIIKILVFGTMIPLLIVIFWAPKLFDFDLSSEITRIQMTDVPWLAAICLKSFCLIGIGATKLICKVNHSGIIQLLAFIIVHVATYLLLGWIIARLVYPYKNISESTASSESDK